MAGTLTVDAIRSEAATPTVFRNSSSVEIGQLTRSWVNFNGVTTVTIRGSFNTSSVTRNGTGDYTTNLSTALTDGNFSLLVTGNRGVAADYGWYMSAPYNAAPTTTTARMVCTNSAATFTDYAYISVTINR